jgi:hypothetical protein
MRAGVDLLLGGVMGKLDTLLDVALEALDSLGQETLLLLGNALQGVDGLLGTVGAELNGDGEEIAASLLSNSLTTGNTGQVDVAGLYEALLASSGLENLLCEAETSVGHGEGGRASTVLGLHDLVTTELDAVDESVVLVVGNGSRGLNLAEKGNDGLAGVAANDGDGQILGLLLAGDAGDEGLSTDDIEAAGQENDSLPSIFKGRRERTERFET